MIYSEFLSGAMLTLLAVALWMVMRALVMAAAELDTVQDSFRQFLGAPLLSLLVYSEVILLLSS